MRPARGTSREHPRPRSGLGRGDLSTRARVVPVAGSCASGSERAFTSRPSPRGRSQGRRAAGWRLPLPLRTRGTAPPVAPASGPHANAGVPPGWACDDGCNIHSCADDGARIFTTLADCSMLGFVEFEPGSSRLSDPTRVDGLLRLLANPERRLIVSGDAGPDEGTAAQRRALAERRAEAVYARLLERGRRRSGWSSGAGPNRARRPPARPASPTRPCRPTPAAVTTPPTRARSGTTAGVTTGRRRPGPSTNPSKTPPNPGSPRVDAFDASVCRTSPPRWSSPRPAALVDFASEPQTC